MDNMFVKIAILLIAGFGAGKIARRFKLPMVTGFLIAGLFLGPSWGLVFPNFKGVITSSDQKALIFVKDIALSFIAFSIGSEFSFRKLKKYGKSVNLITLFEVLFAVSLVFITMLLVPKGEKYTGIGYHPFNKKNISLAIVLASMSAATAPAATIMVIRQYRAYGPVTKTILPVTAIDDIYGIVIFGFAISVAQILTAEATFPLWFLITKPFIEVIGSLVLGFVIGYVLSITIKQIQQDHDDYQVLSLISIFVAIGLIGALNSIFRKYNLGLSNLLSCIVIGATLSNTLKNSEKVFNSINDMSMPFMILFFTLAGAELDLNIFKSDKLLILVAFLFIVARGIGKYLGAFTGAVISKSDKKLRNYIGFALLPQGGVSIGLLVSVRALLPAFYQDATTIIMLSILVFETTGPIFAKLAISKSGEINGLDRIADFIEEENNETQNIDHSNNQDNLVIDNTNDNNNK